VQEWACAAQFNLAANNADNKVKIAEAGVIEAVLAAMAVTGSARGKRMQEWACLR